MEIIVKSVINFVFFPIFIFGLSSIVSFYYLIRHLIATRAIDEVERKVVFETLLASLGIILLLALLRWQLPYLLPAEFLQNIFPSNQYIVAIIGNGTLDIHSFWFYLVVIGFVYKLKEVQYGRIPKKNFIRKTLIPVLAISMLFTFGPIIFKGLA